MKIANDELLLFHSIYVRAKCKPDKKQNNTYPFPYLPVSVPGTRPFRNLGPCLPFAGVAGVWVWVASLAGRGGLAAHGSPSAVSLVSETGTLAGIATPAHTRVEARPPRPHMCPAHVSRGGLSMYISDWPKYILRIILKVSQFPL